VDRVLGTTGADVFDLKSGADAASGLQGDDTYILDNPKDWVAEGVGGGEADTVLASMSTYTLPFEIERLVLTGDKAQTGVGNTEHNLMVGNKVQSTLRGEAGNDTLVSRGDGDVLTGGAGNDVFDLDRIPTKATTITDFVRGQDKLDLDDLILGYKGTNAVADGWVKFQAEAGGTTVYVDADGAGAGGFVAVAKLAGVAGITAADYIF
jgi:Ca2+-binding RTX toxin-like protein